MANVFPGYRFQVRRFDQEQPQRPQVMPGDIFKFYIYALSFSNNALTLRSLPCHSIEYIHVQSFFQQCRDFLRTFLSQPRYSNPTLPLQGLVDGVLSAYREMFQFDDTVSSTPESQHREFRLCVVFLLRDREGENLQESMQNFRRLPASEEAIQTLLRRSNVMDTNECCAICMEEFPVGGDNDGADGLALPCDHVFHSQCILSWLRRSHTCPLCRYALPTE